MKSSKRTLFLVALLLLVAAIGIPVIMGNLKEAELSEESGVESTGSSVESEKVVKLLSDIERVSIDLSVLSSPELNYFTDFSLALPNIPIGKTNPFANY